MSYNNIIDYGPCKYGCNLIWIMNTSPLTGSSANILYRLHYVYCIQGNNLNGLVTIFGLVICAHTYNIAYEPLELSHNYYYYHDTLTLVYRTRLLSSVVLIKYMAGLTILVDFCDTCKEVIEIAQQLIVYHQY